MKEALIVVAAIAIAAATVAAIERYVSWVARWPPKE
jgi:hypothetical protein